MAGGDLSLERQIDQYAAKVEESFIKDELEDAATGFIDLVNGNAGYKCERDVAFTSFIRRSVLTSNVEFADWVLGQMLQHDAKPSTVMFNMLLGLGAKRQDFDRIEKWFAVMQKCELQPTAYTFGIVILAFCRVKRAEDGATWLQRMVDSGLTPQSVLFRNVALGLATANNVTDAVFWLEQIESFDIAFCRSFIQACSALDDLDLAEIMLEPKLSAAKDLTELSGLLQRRRDELSGVEDRESNIEDTHVELTGHIEAKASRRRRGKRGISAPQPFHGPMEQQQPGESSRDMSSRSSESSYDFMNCLSVNENIPPRYVAFPRSSMFKHVDVPGGETMRASTGTSDVSTSSEEPRSRLYRNAEMIRPGSMAEPKFYASQMNKAATMQDWATSRMVPDNDQSMQATSSTASWQSHGSGMVAPPPGLGFDNVVGYAISAPPGLEDYACPKNSPFDNCDTARKVVSISGVLMSNATGVPAVNHPSKNTAVVDTVDAASRLRA